MLGTGTATDPFIISTPTDLDSVRNNMTAYYELGNDIDMTGFGNFTPIGQVAPHFGSSFDGKGHKIVNLNINTTGLYAGLFGLTVGATIKNVGIVDCNIVSTSTTIGAICGFLISATVENCYATGYAQGDTNVGGLFGESSGSTIKNSYSQCRVKANNTIAGFIATSSGGTNIQNCFSTGFVDTTGGIRGGFIGSASNTTVTSSYWDKEASGQTPSLGGIGKTTAEMKMQSTYVNWDFTDVWSVNNDYPTLRAFGTIVPPVLVQREVSTYINPIMTVVDVTTRSGIVKQISVTSFINPIGANLHRSSKAVKTSISYVGKISGSAQTNKIVIVNGFSSYRVNPSSNSILQNATNAFNNENPSFSNIQEGNSHSSYISNPSFAEVKE